MMRSLWTAASGMTTQQLNVDTISNNIANINTTGYKKESVEFKSLLYQTIQEHDNNGEPAHMIHRPRLKYSNIHAPRNPSQTIMNRLIDGRGSLLSKT